MTEEVVRHAPADGGPVARDEGWRAARDDAHLRFYRDYRAVIVPGAAYPQSYYQQPPAYYAPPPAYYAPSSYYGPPPVYTPQDGLDIEQQGFNGGVGAMNGPGGGGGGGGTAYLYMNNGGGSDVPPNGGGVSLPGGYGPTYQGVWQGPTVPTRGGISTSGGGH